MAFLRSACGIAAGLLSLIAVSAYVRDTLFGQIRPSRVTWWVLGFLNAGLTLSYVASGAHSTAWLPASYALGFVAVAILSIRRGEGGWTPFDALCLAGGVLGIWVWATLHSASAAVFAFTAVDLMALLPTIWKAYARPWSEGRLPWALALTASSLNVLALDQYSTLVALYPFYVLLTNGVVVGLVFRPARTWPLQSERVQVPE